MFQLERLPINLETDFRGGGFYTNGIIGGRILTEISLD